MKFIALLCCLCLTIVGYPQLTKSEIPPSNLIGSTYSKLGCGADLSYVVVSQDTTYKLSFTDAGSTCAKTINVTFKNIDSTLERLYIIFKKAFDNTRTPREAFKLGTEEMDVVPSKLLGVQLIEIAASDKGFFRIESVVQLNKLFGKN